jgi:hypothetical protein
MVATRIVLVPAGLDWRWRGLGADGILELAETRHWPLPTTDMQLTWESGIMGDRKPRCSRAPAASWCTEVSWRIPTIGADSGASELQRGQHRADCASTVDAPMGRFEGQASIGAGCIQNTDRL